MLGTSLTSWSVALGLVLAGPTSEAKRPLERGVIGAEAEPEITSEQHADSARPASDGVEPEAEADPTPDAEAPEAEAAPEADAIPEADPATDAEATPDAGAEATPEGQGDASPETKAAPDEEAAVPEAEPASETATTQSEAEADAESTEPVEDEEDFFGDDADEEPWPEDEYPEHLDLPAMDDGYDPLRDSPQALRASHWVRGGIVVMSAGGALLVGAILMGASDPCNLKIGNSCQEGARNRAAVTMGIPAAALIIGGATALGIGLKQRRNLAVSLQASREHFGLSLRGRF